VLTRYSEIKALKVSDSEMQKQTNEPINLRLTLEGRNAAHYRNLMRKRGLTAATQLALQLFTEHYRSELGVS
jgi:hypothetical protein